MNSFHKETIQYTNLLKNYKTNINKITDNKYFMELYLQLKKIHNNIHKNILFENLLIEKLEEKPNIFLTDNDFLSENIKSYILSNLKYGHKISFENNSIFYFTKNDIINKKVILHMITIIILLKNLFNRKDKYQNIIYFETNKKKKFPKGKKGIILGPNEINTGVTTIDLNKNGNIILYRKEEILKVLIHELVHSNLIDEKLIFSSKNNYITKFICVNYNIVLNEAFTESIATIMNIFYIHIILKLPKNKLNIMFNNETKYSSFISNKLLNYYNIDNIKDIIKQNNNCKYIFLQNTNVFSYYILKNIILKKHISFSHILEKNSEFYKIKNPLFIDNLNQLLIDNFHIDFNINNNNNHNNDKVINNSLRLCLYELNF